MRRHLCASTVRVYEEFALDRDPGWHQEGTKVCTTWEKGHLPGPGCLLKADHSPES